VISERVLSLRRHRGLRQEADQEGETVDRRKLIIGGAVILTLGAGGVAIAAQQGEEFSYGLRGDYEASPTASPRSK
jgi:hypothetical protein